VVSSTDRCHVFFPQATLQKWGKQLRRGFDADNLHLKVRQEDGGQEQVQQVITALGDTVGALSEEVRTLRGLAEAQAAQLLEQQRQHAEETRRRNVQHDELMTMLRTISGGAAPGAATGGAAPPTPVLAGTAAAAAPVQAATGAAAATPVRTAASASVATPSWSGPLMQVASRPP